MAHKAPLSIKKILEILSGKGRSVFLILLSIPFCQPLQIPGLSTPFGLCIAFVGLRFTSKGHIWLPRRFLKKKISYTLLKKITKRTLYFLNLIQPWIHPRLDWVCNSSFMKVMNGLMIALLGILLALPLPVPLSNLTAAWGIFLMALGALEDDGVFILIGYAISLLTLGFFLLMLWPLTEYFSK